MSFEIVFYCDNCQKKIEAKKRIIMVPANPSEGRPHITHFCTPDCKRELLDEKAELRAEGENG